MANWYKIPVTMAVTQREYRANIDGMNIVFGAVLGFVLAGTEGLPPLDFGLVLMFSASVVISILYLGSSEYRLFYAITTALMIAFVPWFLIEIIDVAAVPKLQPTLAAWALMVVIVELMPRSRTDKTKKDNE